jgi:hypothetical protein
MATLRANELRRVPAAVAGCVRVSKAVFELQQVLQNYIAKLILRLGLSRYYLLYV